MIPRAPGATRLSPFEAVQFAPAAANSHPDLEDSPTREVLISIRRNNNPTLNRGLFCGHSKPRLVQNRETKTNDYSVLNRGLLRGGGSTFALVLGEKYKKSSVICWNPFCIFMYIYTYIFVLIND